MESETPDGGEYVEALIRLTHTVNRAFSESSRERGLTPQQAQLLGTLTRGPMGMGDLSGALHLERSSLSGLVDRVERRGLVSRVPDEADRRACRVVLTAPGEELAHAVRAAVVDRLHERFDHLPDATRRGLVRAADPNGHTGGGPQ